MPKAETDETPTATGGPRSWMGKATRVRLLESAISDSAEGAGLSHGSYDHYFLAGLSG